MKKIYVVSSTRADFGILKNLISELSQKKNVSLKIIFTGTHFIKNFGYTIKDSTIKGRVKIKKIKVKYLSDKKFDLIKFKNKISNKFSKYLNFSRPDLVILLGDRFEILECAFTSYMMQIPIAHIHGGEVTGGSYDDSMRHAISKLSNFHFTAQKTFKKRLLRLGEDKKNTFCYGSLGVDAILKEKLITKNELQKKLGIKFGKRNLIFVFHPVNSLTNKSTYDLKEILKAINELKDTSIIATYSGLENGAEDFIRILKKNSQKNKNFYLFKSLGSKNFLSLMKQVDAIIGNSSSGIIEMASFKKATINIGGRQEGRLQSKNTINCSINKRAIISSINKIYKKDFQKKLKAVKNIYYKKNSTKLTVNKILSINLSKVKIKKFIDN